MSVRMLQFPSKESIIKAVQENSSTAGFYSTRKQVIEDIANLFANKQQSAPSVDLDLGKKLHSIQLEGQEMFSMWKALGPVLKSCASV